MDRVTVNVGELTELAKTLDAADRGLVDDVKAVTHKGSLNIKRDAKQRVGRGPHTPAYALSIGYEVKANSRVVEGEIGPDKDKHVGGGPFRTPGNLGNLLEYEYGTPWSAPTPHLGPALAAEEPKFVRALEDVLLKALGG